MSEPRWLRETRESYDLVAASYADLLEGELERSPTDLAVLDRFAGLVGPGVPVADLGCGPGRLTVHLAGLGLQVRGLDLSPGMVAEARRRHPGIRFDTGDLRDLPLEDASLGGALAWYSLIHLPPATVPVALAEVARVLAPGGQLVTAFQVGPDEHRRIEQGYGHPVGMDAWRIDPDRLTDLLSEAGLEVHRRVVRAAEPPRERSPQAYLLARRTGAPQA